MNEDNIEMQDLTSNDLMKGIVAIKAQELIMGRMGKKPQPQLMREYNAYVVDLQKKMSKSEKKRIEYAIFMLAIDSKVEKVLAQLKKY